LKKIIITITFTFKKDCVLKEIDKKSVAYIQELEDKIIDLSLQLKGKNNELNTAQLKNYNRILKLVHNLKNPMGVAFSFSEILSNEGENLPAEKFKKYIEAIQKSTNFSIETLNSIASINRLKSPNLNLNYSELNYSELLNKVIEKFNEEATNRDIKITLNTPKKAIFLKLNNVEISEVLSILINNALRYSANNSTINIKLQEKENTIETSVSDEGIGISNLDLPIIFNEFFVVNTYSKDKQKCIGLGLSIAKQITQLHRGEISVKSTLHNGSIFKLSLPKT
jgi:K+-sensing histidine kinase KdpD